MVKRPHPLTALRRHLASRITDSQERLLLALLVLHPDGMFSGDLSDAAGFPSGSIYPALAALEREGLAVSQWVPWSASPNGERRLYLATPDGRNALGLA
jgi:hypothetical protein